MNLTVVVPVIATSMRLRSLVESLQRVYPDLPIYVGAQGKLDPPPDDIAARPNVRWFELPFDYGLSATRNFLVGEVRTEFILLCDDDIVFPAGFELERSLGLFEKFADLGVIGGGHATFEYDAAGHIKSAGDPTGVALNLILDRDAKVLILVPASRMNVERHTHAGFECIFCDFTMNFSLIRKPLVFDRGAAWDERFKTSGEHADFFLDVKRIGGCRVAYYAGLVAEHHRVQSDAYARLRSRETPDQVALFEKLGIEWRVQIPERVIQLANNTLTKFPFERFAEVMNGAPEALNAVQHALAQFSPTTDGA